MLTGQPSIMDIVDEINRGNILLPMIQRPFVWLKDEERITKLFDSVIKKFPIGIILLYQKPDDLSQIFGRKFFDKIDANTKFEEYTTEVREGQILVLDGHQRLQSLYLGVVGGPLDGKYLYHDVFFFRNERPISEVSFKFFKSDKKVIVDNNGESLYIRFAKVIDIARKISRLSPHRREQEKKTILEDLKKLIKPFKPLSEKDYDYIYSYISETISNSLFFKPDPHIFHYELITGRKFDDDILEMFVRFNQGGVPLTKSDLIFSTLRPHWRDIGKEFEDLAEKIEIDKDMLLKTLIVVSGLPADAKLQDVKKQIKKLKDNYDEFEKVMEQFHDEIRKHTERHERIYKKYNFLIPVVYYFYKNRKKLENIKKSSVQTNILEYILIIVYNSSLRSDSHLNEIIKIIKAEKTGRFPFDKIKKYLNSKGTKTKIDGASLNEDPILTFSLIQRNNWNPLYYKNKLHIDHIFPQSIEKYLPKELGSFVDSIYNKYVVFAGDNIRKGDILPDKYFTGEREKLIDQYILPKQYLKKEDFKKMIEWRKKKIEELFSKILNRKVKL